MNLILFDDPVIRTALLPFTFTRPVAKIRVGILTIDEKWAHWLSSKPSFKTEVYLQKKFPTVHEQDNLLINGALCPDENLVDAVRALPKNYYLVKDQILLAARQPEAALNNRNTVEYKNEVTLIDKTWKIFQQNAAQLKTDFKLITSGRHSAPITDKHTIVYGADNIFLEEGATVQAAVLNAEAGPIYLGKNSVVQEGALIRGAFALCEGSHVNMGAKVRGDTTVGPFSKIGGEVSNTVIFGFSNKGHDGFLGNSVLGEWCNLGADTNTSNLKNNYDTVRLFNHGNKKFENTALQFCGLMMGDHSKCGINTMFNTATVVDVCANVFGADYPPNYIPSFSWGGAAGFVTNQLHKALETAERVLGRRNVPFLDMDKEILSHIFGLTTPDRMWEKQS